MLTMRTRGAERPFVRMIRARVELWMVVLIMAMSFGAGVIVRTIAEPPAAPAALPLTAPGQFQVAPPLTEEQITAGLPEGHPDTSGGGQTDAGGGDQSGGNQGGGNG